MGDPGERNNIQPDKDKTIPTASFAGTDSGPGGQIGSYKILSILGEGGYGLVYLAEQQKPVRRRVALKVIKPGMDTKEVIARFEAERQALALLTHPNIAQVYTAETTEAGRPYFVMEYVKGVPITEYCDTEKLTVEQRLKLFLQVCEGVQHAHQKGIIHRDIKPSNILVSIEADKAIPKIIDFGVAKALSQPLTDRTLYTEQGQFIGTPEYMSPEQAEMTHQDIDIRSDIYSLGVVLYELLTGVLPFDAKMLREGGVDHIRQVIREEEPKTPSTRLSTLSGEDLTKVSKHRHVDFGSLQRKLRGDLDWITLKTLEKDRTRRFGSVSEFTADISRHLTHEPILARPPSTVYKIKKFVRRNRVKVIAAAAVAAVLVVGLIISMTMYLQKKHALDALAKLETAVEADRNLSTVQKLYAEGRYQAALAEIEANLQRKDVGPKARLLHAHLLFEVDRFSDATTELEKLLTEQPEIAGTAHYLLARILIGSDPNKSEKHRQLAELLLPQTAEAYSLRGMTASTPEKTIEWLSRALELDPGHYPSRKARALAYYAMKDYQKMEQDVEALIVMRPKDSLGYGLRAIVRCQTDRLEDAIRDHDYAIKVCDVKDELGELYDQRRVTHLRMGNHKAALEDAQRCVKLQPEDFAYSFNVFTALVSLGQYDAAREQYRKIVGTGRQQEWRFRAEAMRHVFDVLGAGRPFELPTDIALEEPFSAMQEAVGYYRTLESKAVRLIPSLSNQPSLSPDRKQLAYNRTDEYPWQPETSRTGAPVIYGASGVEILDIDSGKTRLLVSSGKDPAWSPDGRYIVFVRWPKLWAYSAEEIWLIPATGGEPRRLSMGGWPMWASDSKRLFFHSRADMTLYSIRVDDPAAKPEHIISCPGWYPGVSPDEKYVAYAVGNELSIVEISSGTVVTKWTSPVPETAHYMLVRWLSDGKEVFLSGSDNSDLGLWSFDVQRKEAWQIFDAPVMRGNRSLDRSRMAVDLRMPFGEIWLAKLDPNIPTYQALTPVSTREEFLRRRYEQYSRAIKSNALDQGSYSYATRLIDNFASEGMEYYQKGAYQEAITTFVRADNLYRAFNNKSRPSDLAFIVMSLFRLGRNQEAQASLEQLRQLFEDNQDASEEHYLYEAEQLFAGENTKVYSMWEYIKAGKLDEASHLVKEMRLLKDPNIAGGVGSVIKGLVRAYYNRGKNVHYSGGGYAETIADYEAAIHIDPNYAQAFSDLAYLQAACLAPEFRNADKAVENATKSCKLTNWKDYRYVGTLSAVYAEVGDFASAVKWQKEAIGLLPQDKRARWQANYESRLQLYESGKPYHLGNLWSFSTGEIVAWWKFDEAKNGNSIDSSGNELHSKLIGDAKIISDLERGNVLSLDGNSDYVDCGNNTAFDITEQITVTAWIKINAINKNWQAIITKGDSAWRLSSVQNEPRIHFAVTNGPPGCYVNGNALIPTNEWHHVCGTYDGTKIRLYTDGIEDSASPVVYTGGITTNNYPVYIGENAEGTSRCWNGLIDDVRIYNYALNETEVKNLYIGSKPSKK
jgi:serine/threonine protein kinase